MHVARESKLLVILIGFAALYSFCIKAALSPSLPSAHQSLIIFSNQTRDDLHLVLKKSFMSATHSVDLWMYAATDTSLLNLLQTKAEKGTSVHIYYDKRGGTPPLSPLLNPHTVKCKGLMHRKIVIIDDAIVYLGSANMTPSSLQLHDNLSVGIYNPGLAQFLKAPHSTTYSFENGLLWLLPDPAAIQELVDRIDKAQTSIFVAMFTLTQNDLLEALVRAKQRGVDVKLAIDRYTARGASKKGVHKLSEAGVQLYQSAGLPLLHHKWAYIDQKELILGSTNWTEAAFRKNEDLLLFLTSLAPAQKTQMSSLISAIELESTN